MTNTGEGTTRKCTSLTLRKNGKVLYFTSFCSLTERNEKKIERERKKKRCEENCVRRLAIQHGGMARIEEIR